MSKYYVQSGTVKSIVEAESSRRAALWAVHQAMQQILPLEHEGFEHGGADHHDSDHQHSGHGGAGHGGAGREATEVVLPDREHLREKKTVVLSEKLRVSRCGFDQGDATQMATMEVVSEWNQLVTTLDRLEKMLYRAA